MSPVPAQFEIGDIWNDVRTGELFRISPDGFQRNISQSDFYGPVGPDLELVGKPSLPKRMKVAQLVFDCGLAKSKSEAQRKLKEGAVFIDEKRMTSDYVEVFEGCEVRVGYRMATWDGQ